MTVGERLRRLAILPILALSALLQFFDLDNRQLFLGDQAGHARIALDVVLHGLRPLVGPPLAALTGTNMGPIFYYLSALPVWLTGGWPTGGAALVGLFQVGAVYVLYRVGRAAYGRGFGLTAAALYATSGVVVYWHRMLWPNMAPFCVAVVLWALLVVSRRSGDRRDGWALIALVAALAVAVQLQPTDFLLVGVAAGGWLMARPCRPALWALVTAGMIALVLSAPLIVNEAITGFGQTRAWLGYLRQTRHGASGGGVRDALVVMVREYRGLLGVHNYALLACLGLASLLGLLWVAWSRRKQPQASSALLARICLLWAALYGAALLVGHQQIYPHYFIPLFPLPFLALAYAVQPLWRWRYTAVLGAMGVLALTAWNTSAVWGDGFGLDRAALLDLSDIQTPNLTLGTLRQVTTVIATHIGSAPYNFELLSPADYPTDYKYLLGLKGASPSHAPASRKVVVVQPAYLPPAAWPGWVTSGLAGAAPRFWLFHHVAVWAWDTSGPLPALPKEPAAGQEDSSHLVTALALDRAGTVWSGSPAGVTISHDGASWAPPRPVRSNGAPDQPAALLPDSRRTGRAYAATASGVYVTTDGGATWKDTPACAGRAFALLAPTATTQLAGGEYGICLSRDGGQTWQRQVVGTGAATAGWQRAHPQPVYALYRAATGALLAGSGVGLLTSTDDGVTWRRLPHGLDLGMTALLVVPPQGGGPALSWGTPAAPLFAGTAAGILRSTRAGQTWRRLDVGIGSPYIFALLATHAARGPIVWAATATGLFQLDPGTDRWALVQGGWPRDAAALSLASDGRHIYAGTDSGLYRSDDGGQTWRVARS